MLEAKSLGDLSKPSNPVLNTSNAFRNTSSVISSRVAVVSSRQVRKERAVIQIAVEQCESAPLHRVLVDN